jgi:exopolysaccharide biosynthesis predicted pyruvyltransferase EpsI
MSYILDKSENKSQIVKIVSSELGLDILEVMPEEPFSANSKSDISKSVYPSVSKWLAGFRDAKFVVTDSFHGVVFSIIFQKPFIIIGNEKRGMARFHTLLNIFGLDSRLVNKMEQLPLCIENKIDYNFVKMKLDFKRNEGAAFLKNQCNR